jgi:aspartyl-tRNA(Asn)/glutamyl-tRNA(Gln) amidotransferase subunit C
MSQTFDLNKLAKLSKIALSEPQAKILETELNAIFDKINQIQTVDTSGVKPLSHPLDQTQPQREDQVKQTAQRDTLLQNAPATRDGYFVVPQYIESD